nr:RNA-directed DNA polymerase, eukaryota, reverse transcriptase zinc-binding domain protein [Tanacetum cinerariifolium]
MVIIAVEEELDRHGEEGVLPSSAHKGCSVWLMVRNVITNLKSKGVDLMKLCKKVIENGNNSSFWHEKWIGDRMLQDIQEAELKSVNGRS